jgi:hypothetical protein
MEILVIALLAFLVLAILDCTAVECGADTRWRVDDSHAPLTGAN